MTVSVAVPLSDVEPIPAEWLAKSWEGRIPVGEMALLASIGGKGKGMVSLNLAASVTMGSDGEPPGSVVLVHSEDDTAVVTAPRLIAAGADMSRVFDLTEPDGVPFLLTEHVPVLRKTLSEVDNPRLVVLDPLSAVAGVSLRSVEKVRAILTPLQALARDTGVSILILHHLTKAGSVAGSQAVVDAVRCVMMIEDDPDNEGICVLSVDKTNMGARDVPDLRYRIVPNDDDQPVVEWIHELKKTPGTAQDIIAEALAAEAAKPDAKELTGQQIAALTGLPYSTVRGTLRRMVDSGTAVSEHRGLYAAPVTTSPVAAGQGEGLPVTP